MENRSDNHPMSKDEILEKIHANRDVLKRLGVKRLALFGSHARGQAHATSDLDFLVEFYIKPCKSAHVSDE